MEKNNKKKYLVIGIITLVLITIIGITYSFFTIGDKQELANTFTSGCLNISIENESNAINLNNVIPVTDVEGLSSTPFTFNIKNTCSTSTNYKINLESLNQVANSLSADYIKVSLNSSTFDNIITKLSDNNKEETNVSNSYESHNLYVGSIEGNTTKTFNLRLWLDYDATKEQAASKTYTSKINVIANPDYIVEDNSEIKFNLEETTMVGTLNNVTSVSYCVSNSGVCEPNIPTDILDNKIRIEMEVKDEKQIVCTKLNNKRVICSEPKEISLCPEGGSACKYILANKIIAERTDFSTTVTEDTTGTIYKAPDEDGTSYYYAGSVTDNWMYFGGFYWRIIRINGDGSIRLIYNGTTTDQTGTGTQIGTSPFSSSYNRSNMDVGYMYTNGQVHGLGTNSRIKEEIDSWYINNLASYTSYINLDAGFCNNREPSTDSKISNGLGGTGTISTYYGSYISNVVNKNPNLKCTNSSDLFTATQSNKGNKSLIYPVGLITADEVALAGGVSGSNNTSYYLTTNISYSTITPYVHDDIHTLVFHVDNNGHLYGRGTNVRLGIRPVINLKADLDLIGDGTSSNPYQISKTTSEIVESLNAKTTTPNFSQTATTDEGVYAVSDGMYGGTSYYWRGAATTNYVKFGGYCWRIVRINGDKTMRLIYDGTTCHTNGTSTTESLAITNQSYNVNQNYSEYVGWTYTLGIQRTLLGTNSNAKTQLENWYNTNLSAYSNYITNGKYCNDRSMAGGYTWESPPGKVFNFAPYERLKDNKNPTLNCSDSQDIYSVKIGLITADEVAYAGGVNAVENSNYYLYNGQNYWTMTPNTWAGSGTGIFYVRLNGHLGANNVYYEYGLRPVINLKSDTKFVGNGTISDPYVVTKNGL